MGNLNNIRIKLLMKLKLQLIENDNLKLFANDHFLTHDLIVFILE